MSHFFIGYSSLGKFSILSSFFFFFLNPLNHSYFKNPVSGSPVDLSYWLFFLLVLFLGIFGTLVWVPVISCAKSKRFGWSYLPPLVHSQSNDGAARGFQLWGWRLPRALLLARSCTPDFASPAPRDCQKPSADFCFVSQPLYLNWQSPRENRCLGSS